MMVLSSVLTATAMMVGRLTRLCRLWGILFSLMSQHKLIQHQLIQHPWSLSLCRLEACR